jgi:hypothetical protein
LRKWIEKVYYFTTRITTENSSNGLYDFCILTAVGPGPISYNPASVLQDRYRDTELAINLSDFPSTGNNPCSSHADVTPV